MQGTSFQRLDPARFNELIAGEDLPTPAECDEFARKLGADPEQLHETTVMDELALILDEWNLTPAQLVQLSVRVAVAVGRPQ